MRLGKLLMGAGVVASALAFSAGLNVTDASASSIPANNINVHFAGQRISVYERNSNPSKLDNKLYVSVASVTKNKKGVTTVKTSKWTEYDMYKTGEESSTGVNTSSLAVTKVQYIAVKGDVNTDQVLLKLPATSSKLTATVDKVTAEIGINEKIGSTTKAVSASAIEFSTQNGTWEDYTYPIDYDPRTNKATKYEKKELTEFQKMGATIRLRVKASEYTKVSDCNEESIGKDSDNKDIFAYTVTGNYASKELRVKIAKLAAGPKVTIDYAKHTITIPKTAEFRFAVADDYVAASGGAATTSTAKTATYDIAALTGNKNVTIDIRTAVSINEKNAAKSKPASAITEVAFPGIKTIAATNGAVDITKANFATADMSKTKYVDVTSEYVPVKNTKGVITGYKVKFTNKGESAYQIVIVNGDSTYTADNVPAATVKAATGVQVKTLAVRKATAAKDTTLTVTVKDGQKFFIRKAADVKNKVWSTNYAPYGTIVFSSIPTSAAISQ